MPYYKCKAIGSDSHKAVVLHLRSRMFTATLKSMRGLANVIFLSIPGTFDSLAVMAGESVEDWSGYSLSSRTARLGLDSRVELELQVVERGWQSGLGQHIVAPKLENLENVRVWNLGI